MGQMANAKADQIDQQGIIDMMREIVKTKGSVDQLAVQHGLNGSTTSPAD
jgi:hypothetical protein